MPRPPRATALLARILLALPLLAAPLRSGAAQTAYLSEADFLAALLATGSNDLDGVPVVDPIASVPGLSFGFTTADLLAPSGNPLDASLGDALYGSGQSWTASDGVTRLQFASPVNGFGARFFDFGSVNDVVFRFFAGGAEVGTQTFAGGTYSGFYGVTLAAAFDRVDIETAPQEYYEMDDLSAGVGLAVIPEPSTVALLGAGGAVLLRRRRAPRTAPRPETTHA